MKFDLDKAMQVLERTPNCIDELLRGIDEFWTHSNEGENTWSPFDVVGHLLHGEKTDWIPRLKIILSGTSERNFAPFDRFAQFESSKGKTMNQLLDEFKAAREGNLEFLKGLQISFIDLTRTATHPALGQVTIQNLLSTWAVHDLGHIAQISRVMAKQWKTEVGPWVAYLGVLKR